MNDAILSTLRNATPRLLVYSALSAVGSRRGGELSGVWFVQALGPLGHAPATVRQTLFRMVRERELEARPLGRLRMFRLSTYGRAAIEAGSAKLFDAPEDSWDGQWTLVHYRFGEADRIERDRVRDLLETEGFASPGRGVYLHPRDRTARISAAVREAKRTQDVLVFRARRTGGEADRALVARLWDLEGLQRRYTVFLEGFGPLARRSASSWEPSQAFAARFALAIAYLDVAWDDPELPAELLPPRWCGLRARVLARDVYEMLMPGTLAHGDALLSRQAGAKQAAAARPRFQTATRRKGAP